MTESRVLGVLAGGDFPSRLVAEWARSAELVVAADGGANALFQEGLVASAIVGDMDSVAPEVLAAYKVRIEDKDPSRTDCDKLLSYLRTIGAAAATLVGIEGDLLDHTLAALHSAARSDLSVRFALRTGLCWPLRGPASVQVATEPGTRVSFLPLTECEGATLEGVQWPLAGAAMSPLGLSSVSNSALGSRIRAEIDHGVAALFVHSGREPSWT